MALKLPDHAHCGYCDDPIAFEESFCSEECEASSKKDADKEKKMEYFSYALVGIILVAVTVAGYFVL